MAGDAMGHSVQVMTRGARGWRVMALALALLNTVVVRADHGAVVHTNVYEQQIISVIQAIRGGHIAQAEQELDSLLQKEPNFKLARLIQADLLSARAGRVNHLGDAAPVPAAERFVALRQEAQKRWHHHLSRLAERGGKLPSYLLEVDPSQRYVVTVDLQTSRLYLFENRDDGLHLVNDFYISLGLKGPRKFSEGDQRTPVGVYFVNEFIPGDELPDLYGAGAFPINYPNEWDRKLGRTGYGIWLHGTPSYTFNRPPRASDGCVTLSNLDFMTISAYIDIGKTPVIIADGIDWSTPENLDRKRRQIHAALQLWKQDWESRDIARYLHHYSTDFFSEQGKDYQAWRENAYIAYADAEYINITLSDVSMFAYPDEDLIVTVFDQEYRSSNVEQHSTKRQYWRFEDGEWKIVYEGSV